MSVRPQQPTPLALAIMLAFAAPASALAQQAATLPAVTVSASEAGSNVAFNSVGALSVIRLE